MTSVSHAVLACWDGDVVRQELRAAIRLARHGTWRLLERADGAVPSRVELRTDLEEAIVEQHDAWLRRSRPGGLRTSLRLLEQSLASLTS